MFNETDPDTGLPEVFIRFGWFIGVSVVVVAVVLVLIRVMRRR